MASWTLLTDVLIHRALNNSSVPEDENSREVQYQMLLADARAQMADALAEPSTFSLLAGRLNLSPDEIEVFAAICAVEMDTGRQRAIGKLADDTTQRRMTLAQLAALFGALHAGPLAVGPDSRLVSSALVEVLPGRAWAARQVALSERVAWFLAGDSAMDPSLPLDLAVVTSSESGPAGDEVVVVVGADATRRTQMAAAELPGTVFLTALAPESTEQWNALIREATVSGVGIIIDVRESLALDARRWVERTPHLAWAISSPSELPIDELPRRAWREVSAGDPHATVDELVDVFGDDAATIGGHRLTAHQLQMVAAATDAVGGASNAVRRLAAGPIERLARRIRPRLTWDDLVLPPEQLAQLRELTARYRNREIVHGEWGASEFPSPGVIALFAGPSGTGKTAAAEVVAADLGVDLFKIEVASVVSKYIGETEKNLEQLFGAAASGDLVLCFDEADAILGKRSEVNDARDRYANVEVSYLLQRLETYEGFVVMTTNLQKNIDDAFLRRLHARISFPTPGPAERLQIWQRAIGAVPTKGVDLDLVAERYELVGGSIRNAALNGAFLAAGAGTPLTMDLMIVGVAREYQKLGRLITSELFGEWFDVLGRA